MSRWLLVALSAVALAPLACVSNDGFVCEMNIDCGASGACEPDGFCSFPDSGCASGRRYGERSGPSSDLCVDQGGVRAVTFSMRPGDHLGGAIDTVLKSDAPDTAFGSDPSAGCQRVNQDYITLYQFDFTSVASGATVLGAELELFTTSTLSQPRMVDLHIVRESWSGQGATFNRRAPSMPWTNPGCGAPGSREAAPVGSAPISAGNLVIQTINLDASAIQGWVDQPATNRGLALVCRDTAPGEGVQTPSSEGAAERRPLLRVRLQP